MIATSYKTKIVIPGDSLEEILTVSLPQLKENSVVIITSKIVAITQGNVVKNDGKIKKEDLVRQQAEKIIVNKPMYERSGMLDTITNYICNPSAGIDESNGNGYFILWPKNPIKTATRIWKFLKKQYNVQNIGVLIIDSTFMPLRPGSVGVGLGWCGFIPVVSYIGKPDIFGVPLEYTRESMVDTLASVGTLMMGEAAEQRPLAVVEDIPGITFVAREPSKEEFETMKTTPDWDSYSSMIAAVSTEKGEGKSTENF